MKVPNVSGRVTPGDYADVFEYFQHKKGYADISQFQTALHDKACLPLSIAIALYVGEEKLSEMKAKSKWYRKRKLPEEVVQLAKVIYQVIGQDYNTSIKLEVTVLNKIQTWLRDQKLEVYTMDKPNWKTLKLFYSGANDANFVIRLLASNDHVGLICSEKDFFSKHKWCPSCSQSYKTRSKHNCVKKCHLCRSSECVGDDGERKKLCPDCNIRFKNDLCFELHKNGKICEKYYKCEKCLKSVYRFSHEKCALQWCGVCKMDVSITLPYGPKHLCFIQAINKSELNKDDSIHLIYDIECRRINNKLIAVMLVLFRNCPICFHNHNPYINTGCCGQRLFVYKGYDCINKAVDYIFFSGFAKNTVAIAHFGSGFDTIYLLKCLLSLGHTPNVISKGNQIIQMEFKKVKCIDSYLFFHAALAKLPSLFGFAERKTYFPHDFKCDLDYNGPWPAEQYFPGIKTQEDREWLKEQKRKYPVFNYWIQLEGYCVQDVIVLHLAVDEFRSLVLEYTGCEPFQVAITLASLSGFVFRLDYVSQHNIAILSDNRVLTDKRQSLIACCFLSWLQKTKYPDLKFAMNGPEVRWGPYKLDGYSESKNKGVEFNGCLWHACMKPEHKIISTDKHPAYPYYTYEDVYQITLAREKDLKNTGLNVEMYWECDVNKMVDFQQWLVENQLLQIVTNPINSLREGLYGGRVEVFLPCVQISTHEEMANYSIKYKDANHLYPTVMKTCPFPVGYPTIVNGYELENFGRNFSVQDCSDNFGLIKVQICYPYDAPIIYSAILPSHSKEDKLVFTLCRECSEEIRHGKRCDHKDDESRSWIGTYCSTELAFAIANNYRVLRVFQILKFSQVSSKVFNEFMTRFLKLKYKASGFPAEYSGSLERKKQFLADLFEVEGISLTMDEICDPPNPSLKVLSKYLICALWGKLAENRTKAASKIDFVHSQEELEKLLQDNKMYLTYVEYVNDEGDVVMVERKTKKEFVESGYMTNPVIGSFVTAHARQTLCSLLLKLSFRVMYCDTDSIIYYLRSGIDRDPIDTGPFTGQWKDEESSGIVKFASLSPKNYVYETSTGKEKQTHKGISAGGEMSKIFNFDIAKKLLFKRSIVHLYETLENAELGKALKDIHERCKAEGLEDFLIFDDGIQISRNWKKPNAAFIIDDRRTKRMKVNLDKRSVFTDDASMFDSIVKMRSYPFGASRE